MGSPKKSIDKSKDFITQLTSDNTATDHLMVRINQGIKSHKYKEVDYDKLKMLAAEKKFSAHKSLLKVKKIEQISKQSKENNLMKQHKLVWNKEFIRLNNLRKRLQSDIDYFKRTMLTEGSGCVQLFEELEDFDAAVSLDFDKFKQNTAEPVWELREDLEFWLKENLQEVKLGSPDALEKHSEIMRTITHVREQQEEVLERLHHEQETLERELGVGELAVLVHEEQDQSVHIEQGIPEEAYDLDCCDFNLKVSVLQEFINIDEKFREKLHELEQQHRSILSAGHHGGWTESDHHTFVYVMEQYPHHLANHRKLMIDRLKRHLPHMSRAELINHEDWCERNHYFRERKHILLVAWEKSRMELFHKAENTFAEADLAAELEEVKIEYLRKQKQVRQALYEKVRLWREQKFESLTLQQKILDQQREELEEKAKIESEREQKRRLAEKEKISIYQQEIQRRREKQMQEDQERLEEINRRMAEQAKFDHERILFREEQLQRKIEEKQKLREEKEEEEKLKEERLEALRMQVRVIAESDPERVMQNTKAWDARLIEELPEDLPIQRPLFDVNTFTSNQITADKRVQLESKLRDAGLHNTDYARQVMARVQPPSQPRKDMESTVFKNN